MKVRDVMTTEVGYCRPDQPLTQAAAIMWQRDCGVVPVVDENQRVVGVVTDRDICFAAVTKNRLPSEIKISEVIGQNRVKTCAANDLVEDALKIMRRRQLRRLPVVNRDGVLIGILSLADLIHNAGKGKNSVSRKLLFRALKEISQQRPITLHAVSEDQEKDTDDEKHNLDETDETDEAENEDSQEFDESEDEDDADDKDDDEDDEDDSDDDDEESDEDVSEDDDSDSEDQNEKSH